MGKGIWYLPLSATCRSPCRILTVLGNVVGFPVIVLPKLVVRVVTGFAITVYTVAEGIVPDEFF